MQQNSEMQSKSEANISIDSFASILVKLLNMKAGTLISAMNNRLQHDREQIQKLEEKQAKLSAIYNQYMDNQGQIRTHEQSIEKITALISPFLFGVGAAIGPESQEEIEKYEEVGNLRKRMQLWEAVEQYLRFVPERESKVRDILDFLEAIEFDCSRQSVEAAINAHPKVFRVQKRKNEKFVSLKGV